MFSGSDFLLALIAVTKLDITNNCSLKKRRNKVTRKRQRRRVCPRCLLSLTPAWLPLAWPCGAHGLARGCGQLPRPMWLPFFSAPDYTGWVMDEPQDAQLFLGDDYGEYAACLHCLLFTWTRLILHQLKYCLL